MGIERVLTRNLGRLLVSSCTNGNVCNSLYSVESMLRRKHLENEHDLGRNEFHNEISKGLSIVLG